MFRFLFYLAQSSNKRLCILSAALCVSAFLAIYLQYSAGVITKTNLRLAKQLEVKRISFEELLVEKSTLMSRDRLEDFAEKLRMAPPVAEEYGHISGK